MIKRYDERGSKNIEVLRFSSSILLQSIVKGPVYYRYFFYRGDDVFFRSGSDLTRKYGEFLCGFPPDFVYSIR